LLQFANQEYLLQIIEITKEEYHQLLSLDVLAVAVSPDEGCSFATALLITCLWTTDDERKCSKSGRSKYFTLVDED
jgi:hypothetical protein